MSEYQDSLPVKTLVDEELQVSTKPGTTVAVEATDLDVRNLTPSQDGVLVYGWDGTVVKKLLVDAAGKLQIDVVTEGVNVIEATTFQDLKLGELSFVTSFAKDIALGYVSFHSTTPITQDVVIGIDALAGSLYDVEIFSEKRYEFTDFIYTPDEEFILKAGNEIKISVGNLGRPRAVLYVVISVVEK